MTRCLSHLSVAQKLIPTSRRAQAESSKKEKNCTLSSADLSHSPQLPLNTTSRRCGNSCGAKLPSSLKSPSKSIYLSSGSAEPSCYTSISSNRFSEAGNMPSRGGSRWRMLKMSPHRAIVSMVKSSRRWRLDKSLMLMSQI